MSVRRLAAVQPASFAFTPENEAWCETQIAKYPEGRQASAVLSLLWRAQKQNQFWLPKPAIENVARMLGMPYIRVLEIATFYSMFNLEPVGRYFIQMCGTTPCVLAGSDDIKGVLERRVGPMRKVRDDGMFCWLEVECLGACCNAPMVQINELYYEDLGVENFEKLLDDLEAGREVKAGSQVGRKTSEPVGGLTSLTSLYGVDGWSGRDSSGIHHASVNGQSPPHSGQAVDAGTSGPEPDHYDKITRTERSEQAAASPDRVEDGNDRTHPDVSSRDVGEQEKARQAETKGGAPDGPSVPMGHEPKARD